MNEADITILEGVFARGDRRTSKVLLEAYKLGAIYDSWGEHFRYDIWLQAFENTGVDIGFYNLRQRDLDEILPWDFLDYGVCKKFLVSELQKAYESTTTPNCRESCSACGAAKYKGGVCFEKRENMV